ncbi:MAG: RNA polymerase subunit sigma-70 [Gammaproteobacteria bacterium]|nr:MAG: RNA polymerase subunit sigma-70 [Gammaproteobacteria bacterium]
MKRSLKAARMERRHKKTSSATISLVSLMDIFTILVFFLLFNSSGDHQLPNSKSIKLPESIAEEVPKDSLIIMVSATDIIVQGKKVADVETVLSTDLRVIDSLKASLLQHASQVWDQEKVTSDEGTEITILADKEVPYRLLKRIMQTLAETPFKKISLAVSKKTVENAK